MSIFGIPHALHRAGILGINQRNAGFVLPKNARRHYPRVDNKLLTKQLATEAGIATPELFGVIAHHHELRHLAALLAGRQEFVLKPAHGSQGNGIVVITSVDARGYHKSSGTILPFPELRQHVSSMISGVFSLRGDMDACLIEKRVILHPAFGELTRFGIPDIRVIVYCGVPVMAMCRLPTSESDGRANLHQGAIGVGIDLATGRAVHAALHNRTITHHADTGAPIRNFQIPSWNEVLALAARCSDISGLGYVGVDLVIDQEQGPQLLELNARPGLAIQVCNAEGILPRLRAVERIPDIERISWTQRCEIAQALFSRSAH